jgi:hypothetical protein
MIDVVTAVDAYDAIKAVNFSTLKHIGVSPMNYKWELEHRDPNASSKPAFIFGGAVHCRILEPEKFDLRYAVFLDEEQVDDGEGGTRTKKKQRRGKAWDAWKAEHPGRIALTPKDIERVHLIAERIEKAVSPGHALARDMLRGGRREEAVQWIDEQTGLSCKGRLDYIRPDLLIDLKTARNPSFSAFQRATFDYGYQAQVAFYDSGARAARLINGRRNPWLIALQPTKPYDVACFELDDATLNHGRKVYRHMLQQLVACTQADHWPGVAPEAQLLTMPPWAETHGLTIEDVTDDF